MFEKNHNICDMTKGKAASILVTFAIPIMIGNLLQQFYGMIDTAIIGKYLGYQALASLGVSFPVVQLFLGIGIGLSNGISVVIAQKYGSGDRKETRKSLANALYLSLLAILVITLWGNWFSKPIFIAIHTPETILEGAVSYTKICLWGAAATVFYNFQAGILRALGNSRTPLLFLIITSLLNILLDLLFVIGFHWGIAGAAVATVISQIISSLLCFLYLKMKMGFLHIRAGEGKFEFSLFREHLKVSFPMAFFGSILFLSFLILQNSLNMLGSTAIAAYTAATKIDSLVMQILGAFGTAVSTFVAQNHGRGSFDRIATGTRVCIKITVAISIAATMIVFLFSEYLLKMFIDGAEIEVIKTGSQYLRITSLFYLILGVNFTIRFVLIGLGKSAVPFVVAILEVIVRASSAFFLISHFGFLGIIITNPLCWLTSTVLIAMLYPGMFKKTRRSYSQMFKSFASISEN